MAGEPRPQNGGAPNDEGKPHRGRLMGFAGLGRTGTFRRVVAGVSWLLVPIPAVLPLTSTSARWRQRRLRRRLGHGPRLPQVLQRWLTFADLYAQHNEHRMFFPKGAELLVGLLTRYNNVAEMYVVVGCFLITAVVLLVAFAGIGLPLIFFVPVALLIFSFRQYENMLFGFQISFAFTPNVRCARALLALLLQPRQLGACACFRRPRERYHSFVLDRTGAWCGLQGSWGCSSGRGQGRERVLLGLWGSSALRNGLPTSSLPHAAGPPPYSTP